MRGAALAALVVNVGIVLTGGAVRLTQSGLGCPTWPQCTGSSLVPVHEAGVPTVNMLIEFTNRLLTYPVLAAVVLCVWSAWRLTPRRRDLITLALLLPLGVILQAVVGGIAVLTELTPSVVAAHFLVSMGLVAVATALHARSAEPEDVSPGTTGIEIRLLSQALVVVVFVQLAIGTVVTGTGPHAGDARTPRFPFSIAQVAQLHADAGWVTLGLAFALLFALRVTRAPAASTRRAAILLVLVLLQGIVGYIQYALGVPASLVAVHILLATLAWIAAWRVLFATRTRVRPRNTASDLGADASQRELVSADISLQGGEDADPPAAHLHDADRDQQRTAGAHDGSRVPPGD